MLSRVMHIRLGMPLISAEHEPHLPALQFQRTARSGACSAWIWCTASSTTMPSVDLGLVSLERAAAGRSNASRQILKRAACVAITIFMLLDDLLQLVRHRRNRHVATPASRRPAALDSRC